MTAYVLGAGASFHAGYPLASHLGDALYDWLSQNCSMHDAYRFWRDCIEPVRWAYGGLADLERVLTELDECPPSSPARNLDISVRNHASQALSNSIPEFFNHLRRNPSPLYDQLACERVKAGDVVITFNYDLSCEGALRRAGLWEISDGYGFSLDMATIPPSKVKVLKLHGSTNWLGPLFGGRTGFFQSGPNSLLFRPVVMDVEFFSHHTTLCDPLSTRVAWPAAAIHALIMPTRNKRFFIPSSSGVHEWESFFSDVWAQAERALQSAESIIIIGYSMPSADQEARRLLLEKSSRRAKITLLCGDRSASLRDEFESHCFTHIETFKSGLFEEFLASSGQ